MHLDCPGFRFVLTQIDISLMCGWAKHNRIIIQTEILVGVSVTECSAENTQYDINIIATYTCNILVKYLH